jgi:hypothetical protein
MPEPKTMEYDPATKTYNPLTQRGKEFGKDAKYNARERQEQEQKFLDEKGWSGMGGARKKPPKPEYEKQFSSWLMKRGKNAGQKKALEDTE